MPRHGCPPAAELSPTERRQQVVFLLAQAMLLLPPAMSAEPQELSESAQNPLGVSATPRPSVTVG